MKGFIHQLEDWPKFTWELAEIINSLVEVRNLQGRLLGKMELLGFEIRKNTSLETLTVDVLKTSEIEGEKLNVDQVRSSIARRLGLEIADSVDSDRNVDGIVQMMLDATQNCLEPLSKERLFDWHAALFPTGRTGMFKIAVGGWRTGVNGTMQVVSGAIGKEEIHFQAPDTSLVNIEMTQFIEWFNDNNEHDLVLKAAIAHLWFITIHPFEDGNGRIARALTDMLLTRSDKSVDRFYSVSAQIRIERKQYYEILENTQKGNLDITSWIKWFLTCLENAIGSTDLTLHGVLIKADFWNKNAILGLNERQIKLLNKILEGFDGNLTSSKWAKIAKCSKDTAIRDINDLINKNILVKEEAGGRSTSYVLK